MNTKFDCDIVNGLSNAVCGRIDLLEKMLGLKVRENLRYSDIQKIVKSGFAEEFFDIGDEIMTKYTTTDGTEYDFPWRIVDFRDVYWENDPNPHPGMVLQSKYATLETVAFDKDAGKNSDWMHCDLRQWLNSDAEVGNWWTEQYEGDQEPNKLNTYNGFMRGFDADFIDSLVNVKKITINTMDESFDDPVARRSITYDKFYIASPTEMYARNLNNESPFKYWVKEVGTNKPESGDCPKRIIYNLDSKNTPTNYATMFYYYISIPGFDDGLYLTYGRTTGSIKTNLRGSSERNVLPCCVIS